MYLIVIGWLYVVLMMAVAQATNTTGTLVGAVFTFVLYGALPVSLVVYLIGTPARKEPSRPAKQPSWRSAWLLNHRRQMQATKRPLTRSRRCEKKSDGLATVHQPGLPSLP